MVSLTTSLFVPTLKFLKTDCWRGLDGPTQNNSDANDSPSQGIVEIETFLRIIGAMFDKTLVRETLEKAADVKNKQIDATPVHRLCEYVYRIQLDPDPVYCSALNNFMFIINVIQIDDHS